MYKESLLDLVGTLSTDYGFERSVKFTHGDLIPNRYLLSVHKDAFGMKPFNALSTFLRRLNMPEAYFAEVERELVDADIVHLGLESQSEAITYKLYLEFASKFRMALDSDGCLVAPQLVHLAFKWSPLDSEKHVRTYYHCQPGMSESEVIQRIQAIYANKESGIACQAVTTILKYALGKTDCSDLMFMEVREDNNHRLSFDLNLYNADMLVSDVAAQFKQTADYYAVPEGQWVSFLKDASAESLGHLSGGIGRDDNEFLTVYFGVIGMSGGAPTDRLPR